MQTTQSRRDIIRQILAEDEVPSQTALQELLEARGIATSQPVLSRDLRALGVVKRGGSYQVLEEERITPLTALRSLLRSSQPAQHFEMVLCEPGAASAVARALEGEDIEGVLGTVAGDDTILLILRDPATLPEIRARLESMAAPR